MDFETIAQRINLQSELVAIAIVCLALILILALNRKRLLVAWREWRMQHVLNRIGSEQIRDLVCDDGLDGYYHIDRLALTSAGILLIAYKAYGGNIFCAEKISEWTQVVGQKSFKFENPLFELENQLTAIRSIVGNVPIEGYLFFSHSARFPKGHPKNVLNPENVPAFFLDAKPDAISTENRAAWEQLRAHQKTASNEPGIGVKT